MLLVKVKLFMSNDIKSGIVIRDSKRRNFWLNFIQKIYIFGHHHNILKFVFGKIKPISKIKASI